MSSRVVALSQCARSRVNLMRCRQARKAQAPRLGVSDPAPAAQLQLPPSCPGTLRQVHLLDGSADLRGSYAIFLRQVCGTASEMLVCCAQGLDRGKSSEVEVSALSACWDQLPPSRCGSAQSGFYLLLALIIYPVVTSKYPVGENNRQWGSRASVKDAAVSLDRSFTWPQHFS